MYTLDKALILIRVFPLQVMIFKNSLPLWPTLMMWVLLKMYRFCWFFFLEFLLFICCCCSFVYFSILINSSFLVFICVFAFEERNLLPWNFAFEYDPPPPFNAHTWVCYCSCLENESTLYCLVEEGQSLIAGETDLDLISCGAKDFSSEQLAWIKAEPVKCPFNSLQQHLPGWYQEFSSMCVYGQVGQQMSR